MLSYVTRIYEGIVPSNKRYYKKLQKIPTPEFYVLYNGKEEYPDEITLNLSDAYYVQNENPPLELSTKVININVNKNIPILTTSPTLNEYCKFMELIREVAFNGTEEAYKKAIEIAIEQNILKEYLERKATEVINMFLAEYSYEEDVKAQREEAYEDGFEKGEISGMNKGLQKGMQQGKQENQIETVKKMLQKKMPLEIISQITNFSIEQIKKLGDTQ